MIKNIDEKDYTDIDAMGNPMTYTKLDGGGNELPDSAKSWTTVRDNLTGLIWEMKTDDGSIHDKDNKYFWYDTNPATNGGNAGKPGDVNNTENFIKALNDANYGGYSDWRLPTRKELHTIVIERHAIAERPTIDTNYFPNTLSSFYWSSTTYASCTIGAWGVNFCGGYDRDYAKPYSYYVRAVRGGQPVALIAESAVGRLEIVQLLLDNGADVNADDDGVTALWNASAAGHFEIVQLLLDNGANVNANGDRYNCITALIAASKEGHLEIVQLLLDNGADVNFNRNDVTALVAASENGYLEIVQLLLDKGANVDIANPDYHGVTALVAASKEGHTEVVRLLLDYGANPNVDDNDVTALWEASSCGHTEVVKLLLDHDANVDIANPDYDGVTALWVASSCGHTEVVKLLLDNGADVNFDRNEVTALWRASANGHTELVRLLLEYGADETIYNNETALSIASRHGYTEIVNLLTGRGTINTISEGDGKTPLMIAAEEGYTEIVEHLLYGGADVTICQGYDSPLTLALRNGHAEIVKLLMNEFNVSEILEKSGVSDGEMREMLDANYTDNPMSYSKLDGSGNVLPDSSTSWVTVRDNFTGLIWEVKTNINQGKNYDDPHNADNTYTWYDCNPATNGGDTGTQGDGNNTENFIKALNDAKYCGYSDWRLPSIKELSDVVKYSHKGAMIESRYFPNTQQSMYWSSTTNADFTDRAWSVPFYDTMIHGVHDFINPKEHGYYARAVRGGKSELLSNLAILSFDAVDSDSKDDASTAACGYTDNGDGTVTDPSNSLMWQQKTTSPTMTWEQALTYCEGLNLGGYTDWRLPTIKELRGLVDFSLYNLAINKTYFPHTAVFYWSSTTCEPHTNTVWGVVSSTGYARYGYKNEGLHYNGLAGYIYCKYNGYYVRAVRGGQSGSFDHLVISVSPARYNVPQDAGTTTFIVSKTGPGTMPWTSAVTSGGSWLSIAPVDSGSNSGTITCRFTTNIRTTARTATIRITATDAIGSPTDVKLTQAGQINHLQHRRRNDKNRRQRQLQRSHTL